MSRHLLPLILNRCYGAAGMLLAVAALLLFPAQAAAQIEWLSTDYDFGTMKEVAGAKTGSVQFINRGNRPVVINQVRPSCGCTGADYTEGEILPGDTATVSFTYNPKGRPGKFEKTVKVYTGEDNERTVITIRGTVIGAPQTLSTAYPIEVGPLRLSGKIITTDDVRYGSARHLFLQGYNQSSDTIRPAWNHPSKSLSLGISSKAVAPGDGVTFSLYFNTREGEMPGSVVYPIEITADTTANAEPQKITVEFRANIVPDASAIGGAELGKAPELKVAQRVIDLGHVGDKAKIEFIISNTGHEILEIKRIRGEGITIDRFPMRLKPGKSGECKGSIRLTGRAPGAFATTLEIVSNDPLNPVAKVRIAGIKE